MIRLTKKDAKFNNLSFLLTAREKGSQEQSWKNVAFYHLFVNDEYLLCTNGDRLHLILKSEFPEFENGYYKIVKHNTTEIILEKSEKEIRVINYEHVIRPLFQTEKERLQKFTVETEKNHYGISGIITDLYRERPGLCLNLDYVSDLFKFGHTFKIYVEPVVHTEVSRFAIKPVLFDSENVKAMLMPIYRKN